MARRRRGIFIVLEGIDGAGKSSLARALCKELRNRGHDVLSTTEPSRKVVGQFIRGRILRGRKVAPEVEALLFAADRFLHLRLEILPAVERGAIVVSDRYVYASLAYQGAQGMDVGWLREINRFAVAPDVAIYLDVPAEVGLGRIKGQKSVLERVALEEKVRDAYLEFTRTGELVLIDANRQFEEVYRDVLAHVLDRIEKLRSGN